MLVIERQHHGEVVTQVPRGEEVLAEERERSPEFMSPTFTCSRACVLDISRN